MLACPGLGTPAHTHFGRKVRGDFVLADLFTYLLTTTTHELDVSVSAQPRG